MYRILTLCLILSLVHAKSNVTKNNDHKDGGFRYVDTDLPIDNSTCENACVSKCCPGTQVLVNDICAENVYRVNITDIKVDIYNKDLKCISNTLSGFTFVHHDGFVNRSSVLDIGPNQKAYLLENGQLIYRQLNYLKQWLDPVTYRTFCVEAQVSAGAIELVYKYKLENGNYKEDTAAETKDIVATSAMLISSFFLLLVLMTYAVLPKKRILTTLMRMAYVLCLASAFIMIPIQVLTKKKLEKSQCIPIGLIGYYTLLASFSWMNVMSFDLWQNIGIQAPPSNIQLSEVLPTFCRYSLYGFGAPLLTTLFLVGIDYADLTTVPDFVKPHFVFGSPAYCYFESDDERRLYVNAPILVMTVINIVFFIMTALYIRRTNVKSAGKGLTRNTKKDQNSFLIYLKLTLVMGVNWILDVMGAVIIPESWVWYIPDVFNSLTGLFIFIIFICDKDTLRLLRERFLTGTITERSDITQQISISVSRKSTSQSSYKEAGQTMIPDKHSQKDKF